MERYKRLLHDEFPLQVTARVNNKEFFPLPMETCWEIFSDYLFLLNKQFDVEIISFVLMSNHFHLLCRDPNLNLSKGMAVFMRETSKEINRLSGRMNRLWGAPFYSTIVTSPIYFLHAYKYNYRNPVEAGLCRTVQEYPWSTLQILLGQRHGIIPLAYDDTLFSSPEETLLWLNEAYAPTDASAIRTSFRKRIFQLPKDPDTKRSHSLENPNSVPEWLISKKSMRRVEECQEVGLDGGLEVDRTPDFFRVKEALYR